MIFNCASDLSSKSIIWIVTPKAGGTQMNSHTKSNFNKDGFTSPIWSEMMINSSTLKA
jgi:hypothetical protein